MASVPPNAPPRWTSFAGVITGIAALAITLVGALIAIGVWRGAVDDHLATLDKRMDQAESNQRTYIPILVGLSTDVKYLAERARREDDRASQDRR